jgi:hypothetical protein
MTNANVMRKLGYFVVLSVFAHLWLMYGVPFEMPRFEDAPFTLEARLQPAPPLPPVLPRAQPKRARPAETEHVVASPPSTSAPIYAPAPVAAPAPAAAETPPEAPVAAPPAVAETNPTAVPAPLLARRLPHKGEIVYALYLGNDRFNVGRTIQSWEISGDSYRLASVSETTGLAAVFSRQRIAYESRGKLTAGGLRPENFSTERVRSGKSDKAAAAFDWNAASAVIDNPPRNVPLPANTQDIVSFMYQLGLAPLTPGRIELPITNGWKLERYELDIGVEEILETPFGTLRAVPVKQVRRAAQETIELWLAPAYRWLPVRIRFFNREGEPSGEQLVSEIRVSEE